MYQMNIFLVILFAFFSCNTEKPTQFSEEALNDTFITLQGENIQFDDILSKYEGQTILIDVCH